jgi:hypothetical protein
VSWWPVCCSHDIGTCVKWWALGAFVVYLPHFATLGGCDAKLIVDYEHLMIDGFVCGCQGRHVPSKPWVKTWDVWIIDFSPFLRLVRKCTNLAKCTD